MDSESKRLIKVKHPIITVEPEEIRRRGIPLWAAFLVLLVLAVGGIGVLVMILRQTVGEKARLERELGTWKVEKAQGDIERERTSDQARRVLAKARQDTALTEIKIAVSACSELLTAREKLDRESQELLVSDAGKLVARIPELVASAQRLYQNDLPNVAPRSVVVTKLEGERRLEVQVTAAAGTAYEPDEKILSLAKADTEWADVELSKVRRLRDLVVSLAAEGRIKQPPEGAPSEPQTLQVAIARLSQDEASTHRKTVIEADGKAKRTAAATVASAEAERLVTEAKLQAKKILDDAKAAATKVEQDGKVLQAQRDLEAAKAQVEALKAAEEARKVELRAKADSSKVKSLLAPFTTPGYLQLNSSASYSKQPLSYQALVSSGALSPTQAGLQRLAEIGHNRWDKDRPRWHFGFDNVKGWQKSASEREMVTQAQQLLIELGPVLVEKGLLQE